MSSPDYRPFPRFLGGGAYSAPAGRHFPPHSHNYWELVLYRTGKIDAPVGGVHYTATPGVMLATPPGITHEERALTGYSNFYLAFDAPPDWPWPPCRQDDGLGSLDYLFRALLRFAPPAPFAQPAPLEPDPVAARHTSAMVSVSRGETALGQRVPSAPEGPAAAAAMLLDTLLRTDLPADVDGTEKMVRAAERLFQEHLADRISMETVAFQLGVSGSSLRASFARCRSQSPTEVLATLRLRRALDLLSGSNLGLEAVAAACGFHSASHLSRRVREATGQAPGQWRQKGR